MLAFFMLFELVMVAVFFSIILFGSQPEKIGATYYALVYTRVFSLPFLYRVIHLEGWPVSLYSAPSMHFITLGLFLVKRPLFLFHYWLPKAHVEAATSTRMLLAGLLLKVGVYGLAKLLVLTKIRLEPVSLASFTGLAVGAFVASLSRESKVIRAYRSVTHINLVLYALNTGRVCLHRGSLVVALSHGYISTMVFYVVGEMYRYNGSRIMYYIVRLVQFSGLLASVVSLVFLRNAGVPPLLSFWGELLLVPNLLGVLYWGLVVLVCYFVISFYYSVYLIIHLSKRGRKVGIRSYVSLLCLVGVSITLNL